MEAARSIYAGVINPRTREQIFPAPGSELQWAAYAPGVFPIGVNYWRDQVIKDPNWGEGTFMIDALGAIDMWVESGKGARTARRQPSSRERRQTHEAALPVSADRALSRPRQYRRCQQLHMRDISVTVI